MASVDCSGIRLELKKAPKNGMAVAALRAWVLVLEWEGLRVEDKNREQNVGGNRIGKVCCLRGERILLDSWDRIETEWIGKSEKKLGDQQLKQR